MKRVLLLASILLMGLAGVVVNAIHQENSKYHDGYVTDSLNMVTYSNSVIERGAESDSLPAPFGSIRREIARGNDFASGRDFKSETSSARLVQTVFTEAFEDNDFQPEVIIPSTPDEVVTRPPLPKLKPIKLAKVTSTKRCLLYTSPSPRDPL